MTLTDNIISLYQQHCLRMRARRLVPFTYARWLAVIGLTLYLATALHAQVGPCPAPTPGAPHVCLTITPPVSTTGMTGYYIYRSNTAGGENYGTPLSPLIPRSTAPTYYDATVLTGTTYFYTAVSVATGGALSQPSPEAQAQIPVPPSAPTVKTAID